MDIEAAPHYVINNEEDDDYLLKFEKYVSEQEVSFFSQKMDVSKSSLLALMSILVFII